MLEGKDFQIACLEEKVLKLGAEKAVLEDQLKRCKEWSARGETDPNEVRVEFHSGNEHLVRVYTLRSLRFDMRTDAAIIMEFARTAHKFVTDVICLRGEKKEP